MTTFSSLLWMWCQFSLTLNSDPMSDQALLDFVRQRSVANRITRSMTLIDYQTMLLCKAPQPVVGLPPSPHASQAIHVYANSVAFAPMWDPYESFPEGSLIVKEKFAPFDAGEPELFTGMLKREPGFAPEVGDWEFFTVDGAASQVTSRGKIESCITCHRQYSSSDFVTKNYSARALPPFSPDRQLTEKQTTEWTYVKKPVCWSGGSTVFLPAAWATTVGQALSRPDAVEKWQQEQSGANASPLVLKSPPDDLSPWGGPKMRFESSAAKNTLGYWTEVSDSAYWLFEVPQSAHYEVQVYQGCGQGQGGSTVGVTVGAQRLTWVVEDTGHFQNFVWKTIGTLELKDGETHQLIVQPQTKAAGAVMDIRQIRLVKVQK